MKITIFIGSLSGGGAERVVCNLSNFLSKRHEVTILTMSNEKAAYDLSNDIERVSLSRENDKSNFIGKNFKRLLRFRKYIRKSQADIYLVMLPITINLMLFHRKHINSPIIVSERCDPVMRYESAKTQKWLMEKLYPKADGFIFQTEEVMKYYTKIIGDKGIVIPNAINREFMEQSYIGKRKKQIISAGRLTKQKNFILLIDAFSKLVKKHPEYELIIYGEGPERGELEKHCKTLGISHKANLPGHVNDLKNHMAMATIFVLSSDYEGMPNVLMEAMALGVPCIATDCPGVGQNF